MSNNLYTDRDKTKKEIMENRKLDIWIAENVMGLKITRCPFVPADIKNSDTCDDEAARLFHKTYPSAWAKRVPNYTTDPTAAMEVLEKCVKKRMESYDAFCPDVVFSIHGPHEDWENKWCVASDPTHQIAASADTLPLAICKFAHALFGKGEE